MLTTRKPTTFIPPSKFNEATNLFLEIQHASPLSQERQFLEEKLVRLLLSLYVNTADKEKRIRYHSSGMIQYICIPIIQAEPGTYHGELIRCAWVLIECSSATPDDDRDNIETLSKIVENEEILPLAVRELRFKPLRENGEIMYRVWASVINVASYEIFVDKVIQTGIVSPTIEIVRERNLQSTMSRAAISSALGLLCWISMFRPAVLRNHADELILATLPLLSLLNHEFDSQIMVGFRASRLIIRLEKKDESYRIISENPGILQFYLTLMEKVLKSKHSNFNVYSNYWVLAGIAKDLALLSLWELNSHQQLLVQHVPLLIEMICSHGVSDYELLYQGGIFLSRMCTLQPVLVLLKQNIIKLNKIHAILSSDPCCDAKILVLWEIVMENSLL
jgi:hypothetical protein